MFPTNSQFISIQMYDDWNHLDAHAVILGLTLSLTPTPTLFAVPRRGSPSYSVPGSPCHVS